jgi:YggT family protein
MDQALAGYRAFLGVLRPTLFWIALFFAVVAAVDWLVRTRRLNPFGPIARFFRRFIDPLMRPIEQRVIRSGGNPTQAPWWALVFVVVGGLLLLAALDFLGGLFISAAWGVSSPARFGVLLIAWTFGLLKIALIVRVISSWFQISPWSRWIRWSYVLTEWMLAPLRKILPTFGPLDVSPIVAYLLLSLVQSAIGA